MLKIYDGEEYAERGRNRFGKKAKKIWRKLMPEYTKFYNLRKR